MTWQEGIAVVVIVAGLGAGAFLVAQRPSFWIEFGARVITAVMPRVITYVARRLPPDKEEEMRRCIRSGGTWDFHRKRCKK